MKSFLTRFACSKSARKKRITAKQFKKDYQLSNLKNSPLQLTCQEKYLSAKTFTINF